MARATNSSVEERRRTILAAAAALFSERPDRARVSVDEIAQRAGLTKTTLYRYFRSKGEIVQALASAGLAAAPEDGGERRRAILDAALRCVARWGFRGATMERIGQEASISPAAIYWYFPSKDQLIAALLDAYTPMPDLRQLRQMPIGEEDEQIRRLIRRVLAVLDERLDVVKTVLSEGYGRPEVFREFYREVSSKFVAEIAAYIERRVEAGVFRPGPPMARALAFISPLGAYAFARRSLGAALPLDHEAAVEEFAAILLGGLRAPRRETASPTHPAAPTEAEE